ncbi:DUF397 domain-containing protein [Streptomyces sp. NBC_00878]|uniref:DUF397 domain-containing protein n=1 Tax=Streptomyces sp. NBC_00878 TaxID=2975854 RepID=UPI0022524260|nr:DUF397 domain-containing protein [Streptomyces sp. NBC_00878]MCX4907305.1 DUF397 domain-containing protein [Streptomyces sp. NBC_00878]
MKTIPDASALPSWRKSSYSDNGAGGCVEVSDGYGNGVPVRDSKAPHGPALIVETVAWSSFVDAVKGGKLPT